jgi:hypothetical protein
MKIIQAFLHHWKIQRYPAPVNMPNKYIYKPMLKAASHFWNSELFKAEPKEKGNNRTCLQFYDNAKRNCYLFQLTRITNKEWFKSGKCLLPFSSESLPFCLLYEGEIKHRPINYNYTIFYTRGTKSVTLKWEHALRVVEITNTMHWLLPVLYSLYWLPHVSADLYFM